MAQEGGRVEVEWTAKSVPYFPNKIKRQKPETQNRELQRVRMTEPGEEPGEGEKLE